MVAQDYSALPVAKARMVTRIGPLPCPKYILTVHSDAHGPPNVSQKKSVRYIMMVLPALPHHTVKAQDSSTPILSKNVTFHSNGNASYPK